MAVSHPRKSGQTDACYLFTRKSHFSGVSLRAQGNGSEMPPLAEHRFHVDGGSACFAAKNEQWGGDRPRGRGRAVSAGAGRRRRAGTRPELITSLRFLPLAFLSLAPHQSHKVCFPLAPCKDLCSNKKKNLRSFLILDPLFTARSRAQRIKFSKTKR